MNWKPAKKLRYKMCSCENHTFSARKLVNETQAPVPGLWGVLVSWNFSSRRATGDQHPPGVSLYTEPPWCVLISSVHLVSAKRQIQEVGRVADPRLRWSPQISRGRLCCHVFWRCQFCRSELARLQSKSAWGSRLLPRCWSAQSDVALRLWCGIKGQGMGSRVKAKARKQIKTD